MNKFELEKLKAALKHMTEEDALEILDLTNENLKKKGLRLVITDGDFLLTELSIIDEN